MTSICMNAMTKMSFYNFIIRYYNLKIINVFQLKTAIYRFS